MCGLAGIALTQPGRINQSVLAAMGAVMAHRGPDGAGTYVRPTVGLSHVRLSIVDVEGGAQPLSNEDGRLTIVYNGEVYNHVELRAELESKGHRFRTRSDTEAILHGYEEWGPAVLDRLNGQFAIAIHDERDDSVFLARDRFGVRPLFYAAAKDRVVFGSEVKAIFASGLVAPEPDLQGLDQVFTFWASRAPRTVFRGVNALEPGTYAIWRAGQLQVRTWFSADYLEASFEPEHANQQLDALLRDSVRFRMRADVPVGAYLSGGLDSSITACLAAQMTPHTLRTFSVVFEDPALNEAAYQQQMSAALGSLHNVREIGAADIATVFPRVVAHAETPLLRTAPAPMYLLAQLTREAGIKVVLTGEGSDELFLGYDLFKEAALRRFCLRGTNGRRPQLFDRLYPYMRENARGEFWQKWFLSASDVNDPLFSHLPRFLLASRIKDFYSTGLRAELDRFDPLAELRDSLPERFRAWSPGNRAAFLELRTLLEPYLLSSQGDRMSLAHGVEGRYPFLDHLLFHWSASLPVRSKLRGLSDKRVLRRWAADHIPDRLAKRAKQPYRAPDVPAFFGNVRPEYVDAVLDESSVKKAGFFEPKVVNRLVQRCRDGRALSARENQAFVGILSTQLWHNEFFEPSSAATKSAATVNPTLLAQAV
jgi:asparagine synthase (glutamine-hydrolysing)